MLDEADALSYADLLLLCQLSGQTGLTRCRVVHGHVSLLLVADKETKTVFCIYLHTLSTQCGLTGQTVCINEETQQLLLKEKQLSGNNKYSRIAFD